MKQLSWSKVMIQFTYVQAGISLALLVLANVYLERHRRQMKKREQQTALPVL
jgi:hypothetical protein